MGDKIMNEFEQFDLRDLDLPMPNRQFDPNMKDPQNPLSDVTWAGNFYAFSTWLHQKAPMIALSIFFIFSIYYEQYYVFSAMAFGALISYVLFDKIIEIAYVNVIDHDAYEIDEAGYKEPKARITYSFVKIPRKLWTSMEKIGSPVQQETRSGEPMYLTMGVTGNAVQFPKVPYRSPHELIIQLFKLDDMVEMNYKFLKLLTRNVINAKIWMEFKLARFLEFYGTKMAEANREFDFEKDGMPTENYDLSKMFEDMVRTRKPVLQTTGSATNEYAEIKADHPPSE